MNTEQEILNSLNRIHKNILLAFQNPLIPKQNIDKAITMFNQLLDFVIEETHPLTIYKLEQKEKLKHGKE
jgi:hypothetical protein